MNQIYKGIAYKYVVVYLDDTNIFSKIFEDHIQYLHEVFTKIRKARLKLNLEKYTFWIKQLPFLGHVIEAKRILLDPEKIIAIQNILPPKNVTKLYLFLGLARYY